MIHEEVLYLLFASPMLTLFGAWCLRADCVVARPRRVTARRIYPAVDKNGFPICIDPDGRRG